MNRCVIQDWVCELPRMQQTVLLTAVRGPDGLPKYADVKFLLRWYRRCILKSSLEQGDVLTDPYSRRGGSFMGPSVLNMPSPITNLEWRPDMDRIVDDYLRSLDGIPHHFHMHMMHSAEIVGYKHPHLMISDWWRGVYYRFANNMHLQPETEEALDRRLNDTREGWLELADKAIVE